MSPSSIHPELLCLLFADMVDSTAQGLEAHRLGTETQLTEKKQRFLSLWRDATIARGGRVANTMGDAILATFPSTPDALRSAALARRALETDPLCRSMSFRVGIHVGTVNVLADDNIDGLAADVVSRIAGEAKGGQILTSGAAIEQLRLCQGEFHWTDLGARQLKGLDPLRLYCVALVGWPPLSGVSPAKPQGLPITTDRFIGRERARADLKLEILDTYCHGVTIVGPGGCGKTRLALQVAEDLQADFSGDVYFVQLQEAVDEGGVLSRIANTLGICVGPNVDPKTALRSALTGRRMLLILDNFEQALSATNAISALLEAPDIRLLITSRTPLNRRWEQIYDLAPLDVPEPNAAIEEIALCESVILFCERARRVNRAFQLNAQSTYLVGEICRVVAGLPLAIEIIAAGTRNRSLERLLVEVRTEILDVEARVGDIPDRQRTLRATFDWSYDLLPAADQILFARLGLFEISFSEDDVFEICGGTDVTAGLIRLHDSGLLRYDGAAGTRPYSLLVPAREYARERLGRPEGEFRNRFVRHYIRKAQRLYELWHENREKEARDGVQADLENFRNAWLMACEDGKPEVIADLGMNVTFFAPVLSRTANLDTWVDQTESALKQMQRIQSLGSLYNRRARLAARCGNYTEAVRHQHASLNCWMEAAIPTEVADSHSTLAMFAYRAKDYGTAEKHALVGREMASQLGVKAAEAMSCVLLGRLWVQTDLNEAEKMGERGLMLFREMDSARGMSHASGALAEIAHRRQDASNAERLYRDALSQCLGQGEPVQVARCLENLGRFYAEQEIWDWACHLLFAAAHEQKTQGFPETAQEALAQTSCASREPLSPWEVGVQEILVSPLCFSANAMP